MKNHEFSYIFKNWTLKCKQSDIKLKNSIKNTKKFLAFEMKIPLFTSVIMYGFQVLANVERLYYNNNIQDNYFMHLFQKKTYNNNNLKLYKNTIYFTII